MIGGKTAFCQFKLLVSSLREWGYDVRSQSDYGEFSINGYVCSYRYFGVLDINFLSPQQSLSGNSDPDMVLSWDGEGWRELSDQGVLELRLSSLELFNRCLKRLNYQVSYTFGFAPNMCLLWPAGHEKLR